MSVSRNRSHGFATRVRHFTERLEDRMVLACVSPAGHNSCDAVQVGAEGDPGDIVTFRLETTDL